MATNQELISIAEQFIGLPMDALIGAPLNAAATANGAMALTQTQFLLDTCFQRVDDGENTIYDPIIVEMTLNRSLIVPGVPTDADPNPPQEVVEVPTKFQLPLLTIVPLNSLAVDNVDISFEMEVSSSFAETQTEETKEAIGAEATIEGKIGYGPVSASITGTASYSKEDNSTYESHYEKKNSAKYTVNVHAGQLPLPEGVSTIINAYTSAIEPLELEQETTNAGRLAEPQPSEQVSTNTPKSKTSSKRARK